MTRRPTNAWGVAATMLFVALTAAAGCSNGDDSGGTSDAGLDANLGDDVDGSILDHVDGGDATTGHDGSAGNDGGGDGAVACPSGLSSCGGSCTNESNDTTNCGACGVSCPSGQVCSLGKCSTTCLDGQKVCTSDGKPSCTNTLSDDANCGACGTSCGAGQACSVGKCGTTCSTGESLCGLDGGAPYCASLSSDNKNCGTCGAVCANGHACVSGACSTSCGLGQTDCPAVGQTPDYCATLTSDEVNCGACGKTCPSGQSCSAGVCTISCPVGQDACDGTCASLSSDSNNCGACGKVCPSATACKNGTCQSACATGQTLCGTVDGGVPDGGATYCANTANDNTNCGTCGTSCPAGSYCSGGTCAGECGSGTTSCNGKCIATDSDPANCGGCGQACSAGQDCEQGTCGDLEAVYQLPLSNLVNQAAACDEAGVDVFSADADGNCSDLPWGFYWQDIGAGSVTSITVELSFGVDCTLGGDDEVLVNGTDVGPTTLTGTCTCSPTPALTTYQVPAASLAAYTSGQINGVFFYNGYSCQGLTPNTAWNDAYAQVTVTYH